MRPAACGALLARPNVPVLVHAEQIDRLSLIQKFLGSVERRFSVPACETKQRRAQRRSRLAAGHRRRRREAVLRAVSAVRSSARSGATSGFLVAAEAW
jgi:hypothetical protein